MEVRMKRITPVSFQIPTLPIATDAVQTHAHQRMCANQLDAVSPHQQTVLRAGIGSVENCQSSPLVNPVHTNEGDDYEADQDSDDRLSFSPHQRNQESTGQQTHQRNTRQSQTYSHGDCQKYKK